MFFDEFDIVINATSLGLTKGDDFKHKVAKFKKSLIYIDKNLYETPIIIHCNIDIFDTKI